MKWIPLEQKILQCTGMVCARCYILHNRLYLGFRSFGLCRIFSDLNKAPCSISIMWSVTVSITGQITVFSTYQAMGFLWTKILLTLQKEERLQQQTILMAPEPKTKQGFELVYRLANLRLQLYQPQLNHHLKKIKEW